MAKNDSDPIMDPYLTRLAQRRAEEAKQANSGTLDNFGSLLQAAYDNYNVVSLTNDIVDKEKRIGLGEVPTEDLDTEKQELDSLIRRRNAYNQDYAKHHGDLVRANSYFQNFDQLGGTIEGMKTSAKIQALGGLAAGAAAFPFTGFAGAIPAFKAGSRVAAIPASYFANKEDADSVGNEVFERILEQTGDFNTALEASKRASNKALATSALDIGVDALIGAGAAGTVGSALGKVFGVGSKVAPALGRVGRFGAKIDDALDIPGKFGSYITTKAASPLGNKFGRLGYTMAKGTGRLAETGAMAGLNGLTEGLQEVSQDVIGNAEVNRALGKGDGSVSPLDVWNYMQTPEGQETFKVAGLTGGLFGGVGGLFGSSLRGVAQHPEDMMAGDTITNYLNSLEGHDFTQGEDLARFNSAKRLLSEEMGLGTSDPRIMQMSMPEYIRTAVNFETEQLMQQGATDRATVQANVRNDIVKSLSGDETMNPTGVSETSQNYFNNTRENIAQYGLYNPEERRAEFERMQEKAQQEAEEKEKSKGLGNLVDEEVQAAEQEKHEGQNVNESGHVGVDKTQLVFPKKIGRATLESDSNTDGTIEYANNVYQYKFKDRKTGKDRTIELEQTDIPSSDGSGFKVSVKEVTPDRRNGNFVKVFDTAKDAIQRVDKVSKGRNLNLQLEEGQEGLAGLGETTPDDQVESIRKIDSIDKLFDFQDHYRGTESELDPTMFRAIYRGIQRTGGIGHGLEIQIRNNEQAFAKNVNGNPTNKVVKGATSYQFDSYDSYDWVKDDPSMEGFENKILTRAVVYLYKGADIGTAIHELSHVAYWRLSPQERKVFNDSITPEEEYRFVAKVLGTTPDAFAIQLRQAQADDGGQKLMDELKKKGVLFQTMDIIDGFANPQNVALAKQERFAWEFTAWYFSGYLRNIAPRSGIEQIIDKSMRSMRSAIKLVEDTWNYLQDNPESTARHGYFFDSLNDKFKTDQDVYRKNYQINNKIKNQNTRVQMLTDEDLLSVWDRVKDRNDGNALKKQVRTEMSNRGIPEPQTIPATYRPVGKIKTYPNNKKYNPKKDRNIKDVLNEHKERDSARRLKTANLGGVMPNELVKSSLPNYRRLEGAVYEGEGYEVTDTDQMEYNTRKLIDIAEDRLRQNEERLKDPNLTEQERKQGEQQNQVIRALISNAKSALNESKAKKKQTNKKKSTGVSKKIDGIKQNVAVANESLDNIINYVEKYKNTNISKASIDNLYNNLVSNEGFIQSVRDMFKNKEFNRDYSRTKGLVKQMQRLVKKAEHARALVDSIQKEGTKNGGAAIAGRGKDNGGVVRPVRGTTNGERNDNVSPEGSDKSPSVGGTETGNPRNVRQSESAKGQQGQRTGRETDQADKQTETGLGDKRLSETPEQQTGQPVNEQETQIPTPTDYEETTVEGTTTPGEVGVTELLPNFVSNAKKAELTKEQQAYVKKVNKALGGMQRVKDNVKERTKALADNPTEVRIKNLRKWTDSAIRGVQEVKDLSQDENKKVLPADVKKNLNGLYRDTKKAIASAEEELKKAKAPSAETIQSQDATLQGPTVSKPKKKQQETVQQQPKVQKQEPKELSNKQKDYIKKIGEMKNGMNNIFDTLEDKFESISNPPTKGQIDSIKIWIDSCRRGANQLKTLVNSELKKQVLSEKEQKELDALYDKALKVIDSTDKFINNTNTAPVEQKQAEQPKKIKPKAKQQEKKETPNTVQDKIENILKQSESKEVREAAHESAVILDSMFSSLAKEYSRQGHQITTEDLFNNVVLNPNGSVLNNIALFQSAWHASKKEFDKFNSAMIGTGIDLFKSGNQSTFVHESAHYYLHMMENLAKDPKVSEGFKEDYDTIRKWLKRTKSQKEFTREQHEKFARGFERYLMSGEAPTSRLQAVFEKFKNWLTRIYQKIRGMNIPVSKDVRKVYDHILTGEYEQKPTPTNRKIAPKKPIEVEQTEQVEEKVNEPPEKPTTPAKPANAREAVLARLNKMGRVSKGDIVKLFGNNWPETLAKEVQEGNLTKRAYSKVINKTNNQEKRQYAEIINSILGTNKEEEVEEEQEKVVEDKPSEIDSKKVTISNPKKVVNVLNNIYLTNEKGVLLASEWKRYGTPKGTDSTFEQYYKKADIKEENIGNPVEVKTTQRLAGTDGVAGITIGFTGNKTYPVELVNMFVNSKGKVNKHKVDVDRTLMQMATLIRGFRVRNIITTNKKFANALNIAGFKVKMVKKPNSKVDTTYYHLEFPDYKASDVNHEIRKSLQAMTPDVFEDLNLDGNLNTKVNSDPYLNKALNITSQTNQDEVVPEKELKKIKEMIENGKRPEWIDDDQADMLEIDLRDALTTKMIQKEKEHVQTMIDKYEIKDNADNYRGDVERYHFYKWALQKMNDELKSHDDSKVHTDSLEFEDPGNRNIREFLEWHETSTAFDKKSKGDNSNTKESNKPKTKAQEVQANNRTILRKVDYEDRKVVKTYLKSFRELLKNYDVQKDEWQAARAANDKDKIDYRANNMREIVSTMGTTLKNWDDTVEVFNLQDYKSDDIERARKIFNRFETARKKAGIKKEKQPNHYEVRVINMYTRGDKDKLLATEVYRRSLNNFIDKKKKPVERMWTMVEKTKNGVTRKKGMENVLTALSNNTDNALTNAIRERVYRDILLSNEDGRLYSASLLKNVAKENGIDILEDGKNIAESGIDINKVKALTTDQLRTIVRDAFGNQYNSGIKKMERSMLMFDKNGKTGNLYEIYRDINLPVIQDYFHKGNAGYNTTKNSKVQFAAKRYENEANEFARAVREKSKRKILNVALSEAFDSKNALNEEQIGLLKAVSRAFSKDNKFKYQYRGMTFNGADIEDTFNQFCLYAKGHEAMMSNINQNGIVKNFDEQRKEVVATQKNVLNHLNKFLKGEEKTLQISKMVKQTKLAPMAPINYNYQIADDEEDFAAQQLAKGRDISGFDDVTKDIYSVTFTKEALKYGYHQAKEQFFDSRKQFWQREELEDGSVTFIRKHPLSHHTKFVTYSGLNDRKVDEKRFNTIRGALSYAWDQAQKYMFNDKHYLKKVAEENGAMRSYMDFMVAKDQGYIASTYLTQGIPIHGDNTGKRTMSLNDIIEAIPREKQKAFVNYCECVRIDQDLKPLNIMQNITYKEAADTIAKVENSEDAQLFKDMQQKFVEYNKELLYQTMVKSGVMTEERYNVMVKKHANFIPLEKDLSDVQTFLGTGHKYTGYTNPRNPFHKIGNCISKEVKNPFVVMQERTVDYCQIAARNNAGKIFVDQIANRISEAANGDKVMAAQGIVRRLKDRYDSKGNQINLEDPSRNIFYLWKDGKKVFYQVGDREVYLALRSLDEDQMTGLYRYIDHILRMPAKLVRITATGTIDFGERNVFRDNGEAFLTSEHGYLPFYDSVWGMYQMAKDTPWFREYQQMNGELGTLNRIDEDSNAVVQHEVPDKLNPIVNIIAVAKKQYDIIKDPNTTKAEKMAALIGLPLSPVIGFYKMTKRINDYFELGTRVGEYKNARMGYKGLKGRLTDKRQVSLSNAMNDRYYASYRAKDITLNYNQHGIIGRVMGRYIPFFNASLQGIYKVINTFSAMAGKRHVENRQELLFKCALVACIAGGIAIAGHGDPDYDEAPDYEKDNFWIFPNGLRFSKDQVLARLVGNTVEYAVGAILNGDQKPSDTAKKIIANAFSQFRPDTYMPSTFNLIIGGVGGYDLFRKRPITPEYMRDTIGYLQKDISTSELAADLSWALNKSIGLDIGAKTIDWALQNTISNHAKYVSGLYSLMFGNDPAPMARGSEPGDEYVAALRDSVPPVLNYITGTFTTNRTSYKSITEFRQRYSDMKKKVSDTENATRNDMKLFKEYERAYKQDQKIRKKIKAIMEGPGDSVEKRKLAEPWFKKEMTIADHMKKREKQYANS